MQNLKEHIVFKTVTLALILILLVPSIVKFSHIFSHHQHKVCIGEKSTHIHKVDLDCDFHKFKSNNHFLFSPKTFNLISFSDFYKTLHLTYNFLNNHRPLSFSLRGPPVLA
jgi:hypothetical protein